MRKFVNKTKYTIETNLIYLNYTNDTLNILLDLVFLKELWGLRERESRRQVLLANSRGALWTALGRSFTYIKIAMGRVLILAVPHNQLIKS